jgi:hypothetical protein
MSPHAPPAQGMPRSGAAQGPGLRDLVPEDGQAPKHPADAKGSLAIVLARPPLRKASGAEPQALGALDGGPV